LRKKFVYAESKLAARFRKEKKAPLTVSERAIGYRQASNFPPKKNFFFSQENIISSSVGIYEFKVGKLSDKRHLPGGNPPQTAKNVNHLGKSPENIREAGASCARPSGFQPGVRFSYRGTSLPPGKSVKGERLFTRCERKVSVMMGHKSERHLCQLRGGGDPIETARTFSRVIIVHRERKPAESQ